MIRLICTLLFLWPYAAGAQTAETSVRSGWHPTFTRLVIPIPEGTEWELGRAEEGYLFRSAMDEPYSVDGVFARLPRTRVGSLGAATPGVLEIGSGCDCHVTAFLWQPGRVVVDVRDGPASDGNPFEAALVTPSKALPRIDLLPKPVRQNRVDVNSISPLRDVAAPKTDLSGFESALLASLGRAVDQGLLQSDGLTRDDARSEATFGPLPDPQNLVGFEAATSADARISISGNTPLPVAQTCWPKDWTDVASWGDDAPFTEQISAARLNLYGEFDRIAPEAVETLAQTYLYFGFGREAAEALRMDQAMTARRTSLVSLAQIMDDDPSDLTQLAGQSHCGMPTAMWAFLATPPDALDQWQNVNEVVASFRELPPHLKVHLAPRFSRRLAAIGAVEAAEFALSQAASEIPETVDHALVSAEVAVLQGEPDMAQSSLAEFADGNARLTPDALVSLVTLQIEQDIAVPADILALIAAQRFEFRGQAQDHALAATELRAQLHQGLLTAALDTFLTLPDDMPPEDQTALSDLTHRAITDRGDDVLFLDMAFRVVPAQVPPEVENDMATRLLLLGFPQQAETLLSAPAQGDTMAERRYLRAKAAMDLGDVTRAAEHLSGLTTPRAVAILANADDAATPADETTVSWRARDWQALAIQTDPLLQEASRIALQPDVAVQAGRAPLAGGRAMLADSENLRGTVASLLDRFERPATE